MPTQPPTILQLLAAFAPVFSRRVWRYARVLVAGALLTPGKRTVASALRVTGLSGARRFERYHRVLNRACWSSLAVSRILLSLLVAAFVPDGPLVIGVDETIERRRGARIAAKGIYRDAVRSLPTPWGPRALRQGKWAALGLPDAARPDPLGGAGLGAALPHRAGAVRAL